MTTMSRSAMRAMPIKLRMRDVSRALRFDARDGGNGGDDERRQRQPEEPGHGSVSYKTRASPLSTRRTRRRESSRATLARLGRRDDRVAGARACLLAWRFGDESQQSVTPQVWQVRRCTHAAPILTHSSHSCASRA